MCRLDSDNFKSNQIYLQAQNMKENTDEKLQLNQMRTTITN